MPRRLALAVVLALLVLPFAPRSGQAADPDHLAWARRLVAGVTPDTNLYASRPTVVTVELFQHGVETELVLTQRRLPPDKVEAHRKGWTDIVAKLEQVFASSGRLA